LSFTVGKARSAESIVEEAQGKLTELEQRIKEAIEKNAQLKSIEMMQVGDCFTFVFCGFQGISCVVYSWNA